ncbi:MAG TPA: ferritin-like fold-containing protein [Actinomycetes bacterium]|nr:ferritin-like fold-containing protein [Actinomycetes bacterium]
MTLPPTEDAPVAPDPLADPEYRAAVVDLLGVLAYGELSAFERLGSDAALAPTLAERAEVAAMACAEFGHFVRLQQRLLELGQDPEEAMRPFVAPLEAFHASTSPADWYEGLVKAFVGDSIAADFYREIAQHLDPTTRALVVEVFEDTGHSAFVVEKVRAAITADPRLGGRLALWGRRLLGEALSQAQRVAAERDTLTALLVGGVDRPGVDLVELGRMFTRMTEAHARRMESLGLAA